MHALLNPTDSGWTVEDLQSKAGSLVNGQTIQGVTPISPGDTLFFAGNTLLVLPQ
jgi:pSer/pThr/pTyr-binding forkhead associated (FHA) protein